jgi:hypothetical protein
VTSAPSPAAVWVAALLTLAVLSYLWRDNPVWRLVEHLYLGLAAGYGLGYTWHNFLRPVLAGDVLQRHQWQELLPLALGVLIYGRYVKGLEWLARFPIAVWVGYGAGYVVAYLPRTLLRQVAASFVSLGDLNHLALVACLVGGLVYFSFTLPREHPAVRAAAGVGRWAILVALGASFGSAVLYRFSILYGRFDFLLHTWMRLP